ncbi:Rhodanese-like domain-containing protein [Obelidium mucronatum]|nr:Rhodanese-like domain-containing protein [Obelidium mucronatum]
MLARRLFSTSKHPLSSPPLVNVHWLNAQLAPGASSRNIKLLDASYHIPLRLRIPSIPETLKDKIRSAFGMGVQVQLEGELPVVREILVQTDDEVVGAVARDAKALFQTGERIQGSQFFDLSVVRDVLKTQPLIAPSPEDFGFFMDELGIKKTDHVVVYDTIGIHSSPRAWWMFKLMGHENVSVLDGGLPEWIKNGYAVAATTTATEKPHSDSTYIAEFQPSRVTEFKDLFRVVGDLMSVDHPIILDVRSRERHLGMGMEPLHTSKKMGMIPGSLNVYWKDMLLDNGTCLKKPLDLIRVLKEPGQSVDLDRNLVVYGNDGISAAVVCLALEVLGKEDGVALYDGGWSEWAMHDDTPVMRKGY